MYTKIKLDKNKIIINASKATLEEWLYILFKHKREVYPNNCFPSDILKSEYINNIHSFSDKEVKKLLEILLPRTDRLGNDNDALKFMMQHRKDELFEIAESSQYWHIHLFMQKDVWQGLTWRLDLIPNHTKLAMDTVEAYLMAHHIHMTDQQAIGARDCIDIIEARFYNNCHSPQILPNLEPIQFEWIIEEMYKNMGYETQLTKVSTIKELM